MEWTELSAYASLVLYALATAASLCGFLGRMERAKKAARLFCLAGFALHTLWVLAAFFGGAFSQAPRGFFLMPFAWLLVVAGFCMSRRRNMEFALHFAAPWAFFLGACALGFSGRPAGQDMAGPLFVLHIAAVFVGVGVMAVAAGAGAMFLWQDRALKGRSPVRGMRSDLPSLNTLDRVNALATLAGFPCYCLGLLCGFLWAHVSWSGGTDIKEWISLVILALYAFLFHQRFALGWSGRKPALLAIAIFAASLFSMLLVNTLFSSQHSF
ncbi:MAG: cytochrome c biogenesis protein CcsA [Desulfovibrio sp.]|jgi:ABC-type transport system involved in cytochrome c biogenesis permease subunit